MTKTVFIFGTLLAFSIARDSAFAVEAADAKFSATVAPVLKTYCVACHGGEKPKAELALDVLAPDFAKNGETWKGVVDRLADGSMPPKGKPRPTAAEQKAVADWVAAGLTSYQAGRTVADGRARLRRLNRVEYVNTLRDLLGADVDKEMLPDDGIASGFDNVDAALDLSSTLLEGYLETAAAALDDVFVKGSKPEMKKLHIDLVPLAKQITKTNRPMPRYGTSTVIRENEVVFFSAAQASKPLLETKATSRGLYRFRISANAVHHGKGMTLLIYAGNYGMGVQGLTTRAFGMHDVADAPTVVEFTERMDAKESISIFPYGMPNVYKEVADDYDGPGLAVQWVEVEGPIVETWPPAPTARLLGNVDIAEGTAADAKEILRRFVPRAFRRPVAAEELEPFIGLVNSRLERGYSFEAALRVGLTGVLCSPHFIYLSATPGQLNDFDLANRLSYFLWSSTPDDLLMELSAKGELGKPDVLRSQVERMLNDSKARALTENFTGQWLSLRNLMATIPDKKLYPDFDELLEFSMPRETYLFFEEVLKHDRSMLEFVHSDWTILNERLAALYGIPDVRGSAFRKVQLPSDSHRGGVLTHAAVLKVTANGTNTSPVVRGAWVLDHILGTPAPPPPKDVPAIEPDVRGAKTIREQLTKHRQIESCAACHAKIDPPGNALENFDVIGGWREFYRVVPGNGRQQVKISVGGGRVKGVGIGPNVDAGDEIAGGRKFGDVDGFKKIVLDNPDQLARGLTEKLLVYATGHGLEFADREAVANILSEVKPKNYGFRTLVHTIVQSPTFRSK
jgi:mono/diheme cytochrome c family protein